jgi:hypothetical protein
MRTRIARLSVLSIAQKEPAHHGATNVMKNPYELAWLYGIKGAAIILFSHPVRFFEIQLNPCTIF